MKIVLPPSSVAPVKIWAMATRELWAMDDAVYHAIRPISRMVALAIPG